MGEGVLSGRTGREPAERVVADGRTVSPLFADAGLQRKGGTLLLSGVSLADIAEGTGTPAYVYNAEAIRSRYHSLDAALGSLPHRICFAVKANSNLAILRILRDCCWL